MFIPCSSLKRICAAAIISALVFTNVGWIPSAKQNKSAQLQDTLPGKNRNNNYPGEPKGIDQRIEQLEKAMEKLDMLLQEKKMEEIQQKMEESIGEIDVESIQQQINKTIQKMDLSKFQLETAKVMKKIDWERIQNDIQQAMKEAKNSTELKKLQLQLQESVEEAKKTMQEVKNIDYEKLKSKLEKSREQLQKEKMNMEKQLQAVKEIINGNKENIQNELSIAKDHIRQAKEDLQSYKTMISLMEKDGLLNTKADYRINYQDGTLLINGKKQPRDVLERYKPYFKKGTLHIKKEKENFSINSDEN